MDEIYSNPNNDYLSYLEHHGIPGQKWGVRNAGWYPISAFRAASDKVGTKVHEFKQKRAAEKRRKQRAANLQKAREERAKKLQEEKDFAEEKKRILTTGTPGEVVKFAAHLTNQEVQDAMLRNANLNKLRDMEKTRIKEIKDEEFNKKYAKLDSIAKNVDKISGYAKTATTAYANFKGLMKILNPETSPKEAAKQIATENKEQKKQEKQDKKAEKQQTKEEKKSPSISEVLNNPNKYSDSDIIDAEWTDVTEKYGNLLLEDKRRK